MWLCPEAKLPLPHDRLAPQTLDQGSAAGESPTSSSLHPLGRLLPRKETGLRAHIRDPAQPLGADGSLPQHPLTRALLQPSPSLLTSELPIRERLAQKRE